MRHDLTLTDTTVPDGELTLRPLQTSDIPALCELAAQHSAELSKMGHPPDTAAYYQSALDAPDEQPFVILVSGELAGSTRYLGMNAADAGLEIGATWLAPRYYGTGINRRMKALMLRHAFEQMGMERVQIKTDILNTRSQRAIEKLGAVREGILRNHKRRRDGTMRDTVMYSITRQEWPAVAEKLLMAK